MGAGERVGLVGHLRSNVSKESASASRIATGRSAAAMDVEEPVDPAMARRLLAKAGYVYVLPTVREKYADRMAAEEVAARLRLLLFAMGVDRPAIQRAKGNSAVQMGAEVFAVNARKTRFA